MILARRRRRQVTLGAGGVDRRADPASATRRRRCCDVRGSGGNDQLVGPGGYGDYIDPHVVFFREQDLGKVWSTEYLRDNTSGLKVFDRTNGGDTYEATEQQNTGYIAASLAPLQNKLDIYAGLRVEYSRQKLAGAIFHSQEHITVPMFIDNQKTHFLPSLNITYRPISKLSLRGAYGRTVNRPEFREIARLTGTLTTSTASASPATRMS